MRPLLKFETWYKQVAFREVTTIACMLYTPHEPHLHIHFHSIIHSKLLAWLDYVAIKNKVLRRDTLVAFYIAQGDEDSTGSSCCN